MPRKRPILRWNRYTKGGGRHPEQVLQRLPDLPRGRVHWRPDGEEDDPVLRERPERQPVRHSLRGGSAAGPSLLLLTYNNSYAPRDRSRRPVPWGVVSVGSDRSSVLPVSLTAAAGAVAVHARQGVGGEELAHREADLPEGVAGVGGVVVLGGAALPGGMQ